MIRVLIDQKGPNVFNLFCLFRLFLSFSYSKNTRTVEYLGRSLRLGLKMGRKSSNQVASKVTDFVSQRKKTDLYKLVCLVSLFESDPHLYLEDYRILSK